MLRNALQGVHGKTVLVAPLNWGLGHATRCVPLVRALLNEGKTVILAAYGPSGKLMREHFPQLEYVEMEGIRVEYGNGKNMVWAMLSQMPNILKAIRKEHALLQELVDAKAIDTVISDNRFGLYTKKCRCIYMTHQLMIKTPMRLKILEPLLWLIHRWFIVKYDECWIPDVEGVGNLSGDLSHKYPLPKNAKFIGLLSRFEGMEVRDIEGIVCYDNLVIVSGPEPHRTLYERDMVAKMMNESGRTLIVRGLPEEGDQLERFGPNVDIVNHIGDDEILWFMTSVKEIYCRSGYSSLMDLAVLNRRAHLTPTPGQTEQEYLYRRSKNGC